MGKEIVDRERIKEFMQNIQSQLDYLEKISIPNPDFFLQSENLERTKAIKYSLACAIEDIYRIVLHITAGLGLPQAKQGPAEAILALGGAGIIPEQFAERIKPMPGFRHRLIHDYLPNRLDASRLFEAMQNLEDFSEFLKYISEWLNN